jgi:hypothetical protein
MVDEKGKKCLLINHNSQLYATDTPNKGSYQKPPNRVSAMIAPVAEMAVRLSPGLPRVADENCDSSNVLGDFQVTCDFKNDLLQHHHLEIEPQAALSPQQRSEGGVEAALLQRYSDVVAERQLACHSFDSVLGLLETTQANRQIQSIVMEKQKALMAALADKAKNIAAVHTRNRELEQQLQLSAQKAGDLVVTSTTQQTRLTVLESELAQANASIAASRGMQQEMQESQLKVRELAAELATEKQNRAQRGNPPSAGGESDATTKKLLAEAQALRHELDDQQEMYLYVLQDKKETEQFKADYDTVMHQEVEDLKRLAQVHKNNVHVSLDQQMSLLLRVGRLEEAVKTIEGEKQVLAHKCQALQSNIPTPSAIEAENEATSKVQQECERHKATNDRLNNELEEMASRHERLNAQLLEKEQEMANERQVRTELEEERNKECSNLKEQLRHMELEKGHLKDELDGKIRHCNSAKQSIAEEYDVLKQTHASLVASIDDAPQPRANELMQAKEDLDKLHSEISLLQEAAGKKERGYQRKCKSLQQQLEDAQCMQVTNRESKHSQKLRLASEKVQQLEADNCILLGQIDELLDLCEFPNESARYSAQELCRTNLNLKRSEDKAGQTARLLEKAVREKEQIRAYMMSMYQSFQVSCNCQTGAWNMLPLEEQC